MVKTKPNYSNVPINKEDETLHDLNIKLHVLYPLETFQKLHGDIYPLVVEQSLLYAKQNNRQILKLWEIIKRLQDIHTMRYLLMREM